MKIIFLTITVFISILSFAQTKGDSLKLSPELYSEIKDLSKKIVRHCNPSDCLLIGIGRSPTAITEFLKEVYPENVMNLPLSKFRHNPHSVDDHRKFIQAISPQQEMKLFEHFDLHFASIIDDLPAKIKIVDYSITGESLFSSAAYLEKYFKSKGINVIPQPIVINTSVKNPLISKNAATYGVSSFDEVPISPTGILGKNITSQNFDELAEFTGFSIDYHDIALENNRPARVEFVRDMKKFVANDNELELMRKTKQSLLKQYPGLGHPRPSVPSAKCIEMALKKLIY